MTRISETRRADFQKYVAEFEQHWDWVTEHVKAYANNRREVQDSWVKIKQAKQQGQNITSLVLEKLLPYWDKRQNIEKGYWISVVPVFRVDVRKWFETGGWQQSNNWDNVANAIYNVVYGLVEQHDWNCLASFEANPSVSKGLQAASLIPAFYFLDQEYLIINSKTIDTVNHLLGYRAIKNDLSHYQTYLQIIKEALQELGAPLFDDADVFETFCQWVGDKGKV